MSRPVGTGQRSWAAAEHRCLRALYPTFPTPQVARALRRSVKAVSSRAKVLGLKKAIGFGAHQPWTQHQEQLLRSLYPDTSTIEVAKRVGHSLDATYKWAAKLGLKKTQAYLDGPDACRLRRGDNVGAAHRFPKGHIPANKGTRRPGYAPGRMAQTQFKKGQQPGNTMPLWTFRFNTDGYLLLKTGKRGPKPIDGWEFVHHLVWEQANGQIPDGHRIWWKDRDRGNCSLTNLELLSGAEHMARTTVHNLPPELKQVIQLAGVLKRKIGSMNEEHAG